MNKQLAKAQQLLAAGSFEDAEKICRKAILLGKDVPTARRMLAVCLYNRSVLASGHPRQRSGAEALLREALRYDPEHLLAMNNLGSLLLYAYRPNEAAEFFERALRKQKDNVALLENLAQAYQEAERMQDASRILLRLAELNPASAAAYRLREAMLMPAIPADRASIGQARSRTETTLAELVMHPLPELTDPFRLPATYFRFSYHGEADTTINRLLARVYAQACPALAWSAPHCESWRAPDTRIRIGIASRFLRAHSIGNTSRGFVERLDRTCFEVIVIRLEASPQDDIANLIDRAADRIVTLPGADLVKAREMIAALELDVLFYQDIGMEPISYFLAFSRLAPVQLTSFGHPDTTGIPNIDWFLSSQLYEPKAAQSHYTERLVTLPAAGTLSYYRYPPTPPRAEREHFGLRDVDHVYCCPQMLFKVHPDMDALFMAILERDPLATIVLIEPEQTTLRRALEERLRRLAPGNVGRIRFLPTMPYPDFLGLLQASDVILDTLHFNGQNTTLEALAMGTPVVTLPGQLQRGRHSFGMYQAMDFLDLVASSDLEYVELALRVAGEPRFRAHCVRNIEARRGCLFESDAFVREFESAIRLMVDSASSERGR